MNNNSKKLKQIFAVCAVSVILLLYITTFTLAVMNNSYTDMFFNASLFATVFIPIMIYLIKWISNVLRSYNPNNDKFNNHPGGTSKCASKETKNIKNTDDF